MNEASIHKKAKELCEYTELISTKIIKQEKTINNIKEKSDVELTRFSENQIFFQQSLEKMKNDGRNMLIIILTLVIFIMIKILKTG